MLIIINLECVLFNVSSILNEEAHWSPPHETNKPRKHKKPLK